MTDGRIFSFCAVCAIKEKASEKICEVVCFFAFATPPTATQPTHNNFQNNAASSIRRLSIELCEIFTDIVTMSTIEDRNNKKARARSMQQEVHQIRGLAFGDKTLSVFTTQQLLLCYSDKFDTTEACATFRRTVFIIFGAIIWFCQARKASWFWERLRKKLKLAYGIKTPDIRQAVNRFCEARREYLRQNEGFHGKASITTSQRNLKLVQAIDKVLQLEAQNSSLATSERGLEGFWGRKANRWPAHFQELVVQSCKDPSGSHEGALLPEPDSTQPKSSASSKHQSAREDVPSTGTEGVRGIAASRLPRAHRGAKKHKELNTDISQTEVDAESLQTLDETQQDDDNSEIKSAVLGRTSLPVVKDDHVSSATVRDLKLAQKIQKSTSFDTEHQEEIMAEVDGPGLHILDRHDTCASRSENHQNGKQKTPPSPPSGMTKRQKRSHDTEANAQSPDPDSFQRSDQHLIDQTKSPSEASDTKISKTQQLTPKAPLEVMAIMSDKKVEPNTRDALRPEQVGAIDTPLRALLANYQTKKEADDMGAKLECQSKRLGLVETQLEKDQRVLHGEAANASAFRESQLQAQRTKELQPFLCDVSAQLSTIRRSLRERLRREEETPEGVVRMNYIADVVWALDAADRHANDGIKALRKMRARHGN